MNENMRITISEVKALIEMAVKNNVELKFLDSKNPDHNKMRYQLSQKKYAMLFNDMAPGKMKRELENALRANDIEPNQEFYDQLKDFYEIKNRTDEVVREK